MEEPVARQSDQESITSIVEALDGPVLFASVSSWGEYRRNVWKPEDEYSVVMESYEK